MKNHQATTFVTLNLMKFIVLNKKIKHYIYLLIFVPADKISAKLL